MTAPFPVPASRMKLFYIGPRFQEQYDGWVTEVEREGRLEILQEEPILGKGSTHGFMIWYRLGRSAGYDGDMPKVDPGAKRIKEFMLGPNFQAEFDAWAAEVEKEHGGTLDITHEEVVQDDSKLIIFWRIVHGPHLSKKR